MIIDLSTDEILALERAANYWLKTWCNEEMSSDLESALEKLEEADIE